MKWLVLAAVYLCVLAVDPQVKTYEDLRTHIETYDKTTLVMFFDPEASTERKNDMIKDVNDVILSKPEYKDVQFFQSQIVVKQVLEASDEEKKKDPYMLVEELELEVVPLKHMPTLCAFRNGWASWVHGNNAASVLEKKLADFDVKAREELSGR